MPANGILFNPRKPRGWATPSLDPQDQPVAWARIAAGLDQCLFHGATSTRCATGHAPCDYRGDASGGCCKQDTPGGLRDRTAARRAWPFPLSSVPWSWAGVASTGG